MEVGSVRTHVTTCTFTFIQQVHFLERVLREYPYNKNGVIELINTLEHRPTRALEIMHTPESLRIYIDLYRGRFAMLKDGKSILDTNDHCRFMTLLCLLSTELCKIGSQSN